MDKPIARSILATAELLRERCELPDYVPVEVMVRSERIQDLRRELGGPTGHIVIIDQWCWDNRIVLKLVKDFKDLPR